jgi:hypothetical protein
MTYRMVAIAGLALAASSVATLPAKAQGLLDIGRILLGLPGEEKPPIEYRERAPLVVPPSQNLRPPAEAIAPDQRRANWPQDPDVAARRKAAEDARKPVFIDTISGREMNASRRMTVDEVRAGRVAGQEVVRAPQQMIDDRARANVMGGLTTLREMDQQISGAPGADGSIARAEPRREFLTEPPSGLRRPADNAPFRATREGSLGTRAEPSPLDIFKEGPNTR